MISLLSLVFFFGGSVGSWSTTIQRPTSTAQQKEEQEDYFGKWLKQDVVYIITEEEREVFLDLTTIDERERFIEQFWRRRDPDLETALNEFKQEFYRRIAYANEKFFSGIEGWRTDRGMIYIRFGPPAEIESHPAGSTYQRKPWEGGGVTETFPFEVWRYRHIEGVGSNIEVEFVDPSMTGEYHIAWSDQEKDAFLLVPGLGDTLAEKLGWEGRDARISDPLNMNAKREYGLVPRRLQDLPFERLLRHYKLEKPPELKYQRWKEIVDTNLFYSQLPLFLHTEHLRISESMSLVPLTIAIEGTHLQYDKTAEGLMQAEVEIFGQVSTITQEVLFVFEDRLSDWTQEPSPRKELIYRKNLPLAPGRYKLTFVAKDLNSAKIGTKDILLAAPDYSEEGLLASSLILAHGVSFTDADKDDSIDPFVIGNLKLLQNAKMRFSRDSSLGVYVEIYGMSVDQASMRPLLDVHFEFLLSKNGSSLPQLTDIPKAGGFDGQKYVLVKKLDLKGLDPGYYTLKMIGTDRLTGKRVERSARLLVES